MSDDKPKMQPINFDNLDEAKQPSKENSGFSAMDTVKPEASKSTKTTGDQADLDPAKTGSAKADDFEFNAEEENKNKLPPASELAKEEENPDQRKIAGEAPHVTAGNPTAFTPEVDGGVVTEKGENKREPDSASSGKIPMLSPNI